MTDEDRLQIAVAKYLASILPDHVLWWHTPNGGSRNKAEAAKLKRMGVRPGVPDLLICWPGGRAAIELKTDAGRIESTQAEMLRALSECGFEATVCRSLDDVEAALFAAGVPVRGRLSA